MQSLNESEVTCSFSIAILNGDMEERKTWCGGKNKFTYRQSSGFKRVTSEKKLKEKDLLADDTLTIGKLKNYEN